MFEIIRDLNKNIAQNYSIKINSYFIHPQRKSLLFREDFLIQLFQGKSWGMPGVTHLLFQQYSSMRVTSASYSNSQAVFTLASCEMAVSPFILISSACASFSFTKRGFVSAPELCFSTCASRHRSSV